MHRRTLYIGNLAYTAVEEDLELAFESFGEIEDIKLMRDRETGRSRGFAFITFENESESDAAMVMDGKEIAGRPVRVNQAKERQPKDRQANNKPRNRKNQNPGNNSGNSRRSQPNGNRNPNYHSRGNY